MFEREFDDKVEEVDTRYQGRMAELMEQNTELRKQYMRKCDQLFSATAKSDREKGEQLLTSKEAMKVRWVAHGVFRDGCVLLGWLKLAETDFTVAVICH